MSRRSDWVDDEIDDRDFEYYMWRKRRRQWLRRRMEYENERNNIDYHYHYHESPRYSSSGYYPSYASYYPSYGGYGGYGGGLLGGLFNIGVGRSIGISTPIGGFGYHSGFGIGIGK